MKKIEQTQGSS